MLKIDYWDLFRDYMTLREEREKAEAKLVTAEEALNYAYQNYEDHESMVDLMPEEEWCSIERELSDKVDEAVANVHKLRDTLEVLEEAIDLAAKLEDKYIYLKDNAGLK